MSGGSARRSVHILADVRRDIDSFLDPSVLSWTRREAPVRDLPAPGGSSSGGDGARRGDGAVGAAAERAGLPMGCRLELLALRSKSEGLQSELEDVRCDAQAQRAEWERRAGRDAAAIAKLTQEREELEREGRTKKRRLNEVEGQLTRAQGEKEALAQESEESIDGYRRQLDAVKREGSAEQQRLRAEVSRLEQELSMARAAAPAAPVGEAPSAGTPAVDADALRKRVAELEHEAGSLRLALEQAQPELQIGAHLRKRHAEYEEELKSAREVREELKEVRMKMLKLEQDNAGLRAALTARDAALHEAEEAVHSASLAKRDLAAFAETARAIVEESGSQGQASEASAAGAQERGALPASPLELSVAWAKVQAGARDLRRRSAEVQQRLDQVTQQERQAQAELLRLRGELAAARARAEESKVAARRARDECDAQAARVSVLREAITRGTGVVKEGGSDELNPQLEASRRHAAGLEEVVKAKDAAISQVKDELDALRKDVSRLSDAEARATRLEQVNSELWSTNRELQRQQEKLAVEIHESRHADGDVGVVASSALGVVDAAASHALDLARASPSPLTEGSPSVGDGQLERQHFVRELQHFRKAIRKYAQEFREGLYGLLGWKVEMRAEGSAMLWTLTSRFSKGRTLAFQLRPVEAGRRAQFDLLATPWGEELQADRQAMAYLEVYGSIPGFLAHVTAGLLRQEAAPS